MSRVRAPQITKRGNVTLISFGPEFEYLDEPSLDDVKAVLLEIGQTADPPWVVLDLSHTKFFGSAFIEVLFRTWKRLTSRGGGFCICGLTPYCAEVIGVTHLDKLWDCFPTSDEAVAALDRK